MILRNHMAGKAVSRSIITNTLHNFSYSSCLLPTLALSVHNYISCTLLITLMVIFTDLQSVEIWGIGIAGMIVCMIINKMDRLAFLSLVSSFFNIYN